jgi:pantothenate kinase
MQVRQPDNRPPPQASVVTMTCQATVAQLAERVGQLARDRPRTLVGITGPPGAGKSTLAAALANRLTVPTSIVGMDGFHLAQAELNRLGRTDRKGAVDTFDARGYVALLRRLRDNVEPVVYAPRFRRDLEEPIAAAVPVPRDASCILTEGNYLLSGEPGWREVRPLLDEVWYLDLPDEVRHDRLVRRRVGYGVTEDEARRWTLGSDEHNAQVVAATRDRADLVVELIDVVPS